VGKLESKFNEAEAAQSAAGATAYRGAVAISFSIPSIGPMPPRAPVAVQFNAAAAQAKSSCRASGHP